jgi:hypothetical protein
MAFETLEGALAGYEQQAAELEKVKAKNTELLAKLAAAKPAIELLKAHPDLNAEAYTALRTEVDELKSSIDTKTKEAVGAVKTDSDARLKAIEAQLKAVTEEREEQKALAEAEKKRREQADLERDALALLGNDELQVYSPRQLFALIGSKIRRNETEALVYQENEYVDAVPLKEYVDSLRENREYLNQFKARSGGSGAENAAGSRQATNNPWRKETFNLTMQGRIEKDDPAKAVRLRKEAGLG